MQTALCRHIKTNGLRCKSPALEEAAYCFFHHRLNNRHSVFRHTSVTAGYLVPGQHIQLTSLEDRESIQVALSVVINALATGRLETKRAAALLYGLQLASSNAANLNLAPFAPDVVRQAESTPDGLDLAEPTLAELTDPVFRHVAEEPEEEEEDEDYD